jgi:hypothetical protein
LGDVLREQDRLREAVGAYRNGVRAAADADTDPVR